MPTDGGFTEVVADLLEALEASRITLRLDQPGKNFPVIAEANAPGVESIRADESIDQRNAATVRHMDMTRKPVVIRDAERDEPACPQAMIDVYGLRAFMLGPVITENELIGWISVHENEQPRDWTGEDVRVLMEACEAVRGAAGGRGTAR